MRVVDPNRGRLQRLLLLAVLAIAVAGYVLLRGMGAPDTNSELRTLPEAALVYPGSDVIADGGRDAGQSITGSVSAAAWQLLGTDGSPDEIEAFYALELAALGWADGAGGTSSGISATGEIRARAWSKDGVVFRLGLRDPESWRADPELFSRYRSVYDARLIANVDRDD